MNTPRQELNDVEGMARDPRLGRLPRPLDVFPRYRSTGLPTPEPQYVEDFTQSVSGVDGSYDDFILFPDMPDTTDSRPLFPPL